MPKTSLPRMAVTMVLGAAVATLLALMWFTLSAEAASPKATTKTFTNGNQIRIPADRISGGTGGKADPYPSTINVSGFKRVTDVNVTIRSVTHPGSNDDFISATVEPNLHSAFSPKKVFVPSQANPSNPQEVSFKGSNVWHVDDLDTELGDEEIYAYVILDENTVGGIHSGARSNQQSISP